MPAIRFCPAWNEEQQQHEHTHIHITTCSTRILFIINAIDAEVSMKRTLHHNIEILNFCAGNPIAARRCLFLIKWLYLWPSSRIIVNTTPYTRTIRMNEMNEWRETYEYTHKRQTLKIENNSNNQPIQIKHNVKCGAAVYAVELALPHTHNMMNNSNNNINRRMSERPACAHMCVCIWRRKLRARSCFQQLTLYNSNIQFSHMCTMLSNQESHENPFQIWSDHANSTQDIRWALPKCSTVKK